jgi:glycosyltransferase involved in cell wall biosynthesis
MNLSVIVASKRFNDIDDLIDRINIRSLIDNGAEVLFVLFDDSFKFEFHSPNIQIITSQKKGIYASYNVGIKNSRNEFYLILGDDDYLISNSKVISSVVGTVDSDIAVFDVVKKYKIVSGFFPRRINSTVLGIFPSHTGGMLIKKSLHSELGYYDEELKYLSDQLFLINCIQQRKSILHFNIIMSIIGSQGISSSYLATLVELRLIIKKLGLGYRTYVISYYLFVKRFLKDRLCEK